MKQKIFALLLTASLATASNAVTITSDSPFQYSFKTQDLTQYDTGDWGGYMVTINIQSSYTGSDPMAAIYLQMYGNEDFTSPNFFLFDLPTAGSSLAASTDPTNPAYLTDLGWIDGTGSFTISTSGDPVFLDKVTLQIDGPSVGYRKEILLSAVPEPSTLAYLLSGILSIGALLARRKLNRKASA